MKKNTGLIFAFVAVAVGVYWYKKKTTTSASTLLPSPVNPQGTGTFTPIPNMPA